MWLWKQSPWKKTVIEICLNTMLLRLWNINNKASPLIHVDNHALIPNQLWASLPTWTGPCVLPRLVVYPDGRVMSWASHICTMTCQYSEEQTTCLCCWEAKYIFPKLRCAVHTVHLKSGKMPAPESNWLSFIKHFRNGRNFFNACLVFKTRCSINVQ